MDSKITVYGTPWCAFCHAAMQYFDKIGVKYTYKDVERDIEAAHEMVDKSHQMGVPVLDIGGQIVVGFNKPVIDQALEAHHLK